MNVANRLNFFLLTLILLICSYQFYSLLSPREINSDSVFGFYTMQDYFKFNKFNYCYNYILFQRNISLTDNNLVYMAWWTPGQYAIPMIFIWTFGLSIGHAANLTTFLFSIIGLIGWYKFSLKVSNHISLSLAFILLIISNPVYFSNINYFFGGELLIFAITPYYLLFLFQMCEKTKYIQLPVFFLLNLAGLFSKSSFLIIIISGTVFIGLSCFKKYTKTQDKKLIIFAISSTVFAILACILFKFVFLDLGDSPNKLLWFTWKPSLLFTIISNYTLSGSGIYFGFAQAANLAKKLTGSDLNFLFNFFLTFVFIASIPFIYKINKNKHHYLNALICFSLVYLAVFIFLYSFNTSIDDSYRHFKTVGFLWLLGILSLIPAATNSRKKIIYAFISIIIGKSLFDFHGIAYMDIDEKFKSKHFFLHDYSQDIDEQGMKILKKVDNDKNTLVCFFSHARPSLELTTARRMVVRVSKVGLENVGLFHGRTKELYVLLTKEQFEKNALSKFTDYKHFRIIYTNGKYYICQGV